MRAALKFVSSLVLLVALIAAAIAAVYATAHWVLHSLFRGVDPTVSAAIIAATATAIVSVATLILSRRADSAALVEQDIRRSKLPVYEQLLTAVFDLLNAAGNSGDDDIPEADTATFVQAISEVTPRLVMWSSDDVLVEWSRYRRANHDGPPTQVLNGFADLLLAIRRDFGHKSKDLSKADLLGLWVNDIDEHAVDQST